jgi:hypothetical protein
MENSLGFLLSAFSLTFINIKDTCLSTSSLMASPCN